MDGTRGNLLDTYLPVDADANLGAAVVLMWLSLMASPWSLPVEVWWPGITTEMGVLDTIGAAVDVVLHGSLLLAARGGVVAGT